MSFGTDDPNVQELLARNASAGAPDPLAVGGMSPSQAPQFPNPALPMVGQPQIDQKPGGVKRFLQGMLGGMADAAMKESTGMNFMERQLAQQEIQQKRLQNQYAPAEHEARLNALSAQPRFDPENGQWVGTMNDAQYQQYLKGAAAAKTNAKAKKDVADTQAASRMNVAQLQMAIAQHKGAKYIPDMGPDRKPFYHIMNPYGQEIGTADVSTIPNLMQKVSTTQEFKQLDDGSIVSIPKTTVSGPAAPGQGAGPGGKRGGIQPLTDANGTPLVGKGAITSTTRTMVETAPKVIDLVDRIGAQIDALEKSGELGPGASRWNQAWSGKVGADNPEFRAMQTNTTLLSTLLMRMHMGARGGQQIMDHFDQMIGAGHQSAANMRATMEQIKTYAGEVRGAAPLPANYGKGGGAAPKSSGGGINIKRDANGRITGIE